MVGPRCGKGGCERPTELVYHAGLVLIAPGRGSGNLGGRGAVPGSGKVEAVHRAADAEWAAVQDVGVDHRRGDVLVAEQFLDRADVLAVLEEVGGEGMAQGVTGRSLAESGSQDGFAHGSLDDGFVQVVAAGLSRLDVAVCAGRREDPWPGGRASGPGELVGERLG